MSTRADAQEIRMTLLFVCVPEDSARIVLTQAGEQAWTVTQALFDGYISARRRPHMPEALRSGDGSIALIDFDADPEQAGAAASYLRQVFGDRIVIIALCSRTDAGSVLNALRAGCTEFLTCPLQPQAVGHALRRAEQHLLDRTSVGKAAGSVLALLGAKGGVGATTLSVHLATYLVQQNRKKVLLIDSKAQFGHVCIYLGMDGSSCHFQELVSNVHRLDSELLQAFVGHHASGLDLLSSPDLGQDARPMHSEDVTATLEFLRGEYDLVIVDCDDSGSSVTQAILAASSQLYLVATPDITAIRDLSRHVDELSEVQNSAPIRVVINRYSSQFAVSLEAIEKAIRMSVSFSVPNNYIELVRSANLGEPVSAEAKSGFTAELLRWAQSLVGNIGPQPAAMLASSAPKRLWHSLKAIMPGTGLIATTATPKERQA